MENSKSAIQMTVTVDASRDQVFDAWTEPSELVRWFPSQAESDAKTGGKFRFTWKFEESSRDGSQQGRYQEIRAGERIRYPWMTGPDGEQETTVDIQLQGEGGSSTVLLHHDGWGPGEEQAALRENHEAPWTFYLENLKSYLE